MISTERMMIALRVIPSKQFTADTFQKAYRRISGKAIHRSSALVALKFMTNEGYIKIVGKVAKEGTGTRHKIYEECRTCTTS